MMRRRCDNSSCLSIGQPVGGKSRFISQLAESCVGCLLLINVCSQVARGQEVIDERREYNVKAVSLYAFGRYVSWPDSAFPSAESPFVIGVLGGNPFGDALERIASKKTLNGRPIKVRPLTDVHEAAQCHMVFVTRRVNTEIQNELFAHVAGKPVLLVGETPGFAERGGIINFYQSGTNVRFELNPEKGTESQLSLNAKLLSLGTKASSRK
jgi:hypothetical protein